MKLLQFFHTIRHLTAGQILFQFIRRIQKITIVHKLQMCSIGYRTSPPSLRNHIPIKIPSPHTNLKEDPTTGSYSFLNKTQNIGWPPKWAPSGNGDLWDYNLHYFDWVWGLKHEDAKTAVIHWIKENDLSDANLGWDPYPTSLRIINWCGFFIGAHYEETLGDKIFLSELWNSINLQCTWLSARLEKHILGNHYLENGVALFVASSYFKGHQTEKWKKTANAIILTQIPEQIFNDGIHFERSPMYHLRVTYLLIVIYTLGDHKIRDYIRLFLKKMLVSLNYLCHPDNEIALLNDSAINIYHTPKHLFTLANDILSDTYKISATGCFALTDSGYYGSKTIDGSYIICNVGNVNPSYQPGHAHADLFSFELSLQNQRVIVDSGIYDYAESEMRNYCRSTKAHNTVSINRKNQSNVWGKFRMGTRVSPENIKWQTTDEDFTLSAEYFQNSFVSKKTINHRRLFSWSHKGILDIEDHIHASEEASIDTMFHLHPNCNIISQGEKTITIGYGVGKILFSYNSDQILTLEKSWYCPEFGEKIENITLKLETKNTIVKNTYSFVAL